MGRRTKNGKRDIQTHVLALRANAVRAVQAAYDRQGLHTSALEPYTGQEVF